ncbi:MAG: efflux RND transporter periplasmic adaptor subunit [Ideonella sp.]|nr:efflux RND transporter periplasmic adaptor subunit [Ideonella sp.]
MRRWLKWTVALAIVALIGAFAARAIIARKAEPAQLGAPPVAGAALDLSPGDLLVLQPGELVRTLAISGGLKAYESAIVKARVAAEVRQITVREGDAVKAGQLLGRLDTTEFDWRLRQAEQQAESARAQLDIAERSLTNNRALVEQGFISKNALDTSVMSAAGARASLEAARAAAELARKALADTDIRAPLSGQVSQRFVQPGERVGVDARLLEIVDLSRLELEAALSPEDIASIRVGSPARLQVDGFAAPVPARVARINPSTQAGTRAVMAYLALDPVPGLRQGLFARGVVELERKPALVLPASAVRIDQALPYVLVVAQGKAVQRKVTPGARGQAGFGGGQPEPAIAIDAGLAPGDVVLRASVGALRDGTPVRLPAPAASAVSAASAAAAR